MSYILGSFIPHPVTADIVGFMSDDDIRTYNLLSPIANRLVKYYNLMKNDFYYIGVRIEDEKAIFELKSLNGRDRSFEIDSNNTRDIRRSISLLLAKGRTIREICWKDIDIDEFCIRHFLKTQVKQIKFHRSAIDVSPDLFMKFILKFPRAVQLKDVEITNRLLNKESILLLGQRIGVKRSWKAEHQNFQSGVIDVTDDTLKEIKRLSRNAGDKYSPHLHLKGFLTGFTLNGIREYSGYCFGILGYDQLAEALDYLKQVHANYHLLSWNGQKTLASEERYFRGLYTRKFIISLNENVTGPLSEDCLPVRGIPPQVLRMFDNMVKALNIGDDEEFTTEKYDIGSVVFSFDDSRGKLDILVKRFGSSNVKLVRTNVTLKKACHLVVNFLKMCRFIRSVSWDGFCWNQEFYDLLKPISTNIDVEETNGLLGKFGLSKGYATKVVLSNEMLAAYLGKEYHIDWRLLSNSDESGKLSNPLTDKLLQLLFTNEHYYPPSFDFQMYTSLFTVNGIKLFVKELTSYRNYTHGDCYSRKYNMGRIHVSNINDVEAMIEEYEAKKNSQWKVIYKGKKNVCSVTIKKLTTGGNSYSIKSFTVLFDITVDKP